MAIIIAIIIAAVVLKIKKESVNVKMDNYDMSKVSIGKMAVDKETNPAKIRQNLVNGKYNKDENWRI